MKTSNVIKSLIAAGIAAVGAGSYAFWRRAVLRVDNPPRHATEEAKAGTHWESTLPFIRNRLAWLDQQKTEPVSITSFDGLKLKGVLLPAKEESEKVVLAVHGYTSCGDNEYAAMSYFFHENGYHVLLVDDRAHGASEGKYVGYGCLDREDVYRWTRFLHDRFQGKCSIYLHGISMGATTVLMAGSMSLPPSVKGIVADCGFTSPWEEFAYLLKHKYHCPVYPALPVVNLINKVVAGYGFKDCDARKEAANTSIPVFIIHGEKDRFVPASMAREIYDACASGKQLWLVKDAAHAESYYVARKEYEERVLDFLKSLERV